MKPQIPPCIKTTRYLLSYYRKQVDSKSAFPPIELERATQEVVADVGYSNQLVEALVDSWLKENK